MTKLNFLLEIGTEDLPHKSLILIAKSLLYNFIIELKKYKINYIKINWFATSRRLAIKIYNLSILKLKKIKKYNNNNLYINSNNKKKYNINFKLFKKKIIKVINNSLNKLNKFKKMRWNNKKIFFIRPIRNIIILLNNKLISIPTSILGIKSTRKIYGHHFMGIKKIIIKNANNYPNILFSKCKVIADYNIRKFLIIKKIIFKIINKIGITDLDIKFLNELTSLVEWPVILIGNFKKKFLKYPIEPIIYIMKKYQKILPIYNKKKILSKFVLILNIKSINSNIIINDNEKLLNYRLNNISIFFKKDCKKSLENNLNELKKIILQKKMGTLYEKIFRIIIISILISNINKFNINYSIRLNLISKCDLIKNVVIKFPKLKGIMGMYYSHYYKESENISISLNKKININFLNNNIIKKKKLLSSLLLISNKIDFLVGIFGIGYISKSKRDPFEIRRNTLYILNTIINEKIKLNLKNIIIKSILLYGNKIKNNNVINDIINFIFKRFYFLYIKKGYSEEIIKSINKYKFINILNFYNYLKSIKFFLNIKNSYNLINSNKRIKNILYKYNNIIYKKIKISLLKKKYEIKLFKKIILLNKKINKLIFKKKYKNIFIEFININKYIIIFFNKIIIINKNNKICINRLTILNKIKNIFLKIIDISIFK